MLATVEERIDGNRHRWAPVAIACADNRTSSQALQAVRSLAPCWGAAVKTASWPPKCRFDPAWLQGTKRSSPPLLAGSTAVSGSSATIASPRGCGMSLPLTSPPADGLAQALSSLSYISR
jgi:hypothetical protein